MRKNKCIFVLVVLLVLTMVISIGLTGCGRGEVAQTPVENKTESNDSQQTSDTQTDTEQTEQSTIPTDKEFEIKIMSWQGQNPAYWDGYQYAIDEYMKRHPNVNIEHIYQPLWGGGYDKLLDTQFVAHKAPDAIQLFPGWLQKYTDQDYLMLLDEYMYQPTPYSEEKKWVETFINGESGLRRLRTLNKYGGINFVPTEAGPGVASWTPFYYNKKILQEAGVEALPETWDEFIEVCKKIKNAGYVPVAADNTRWLQWIVGYIGNQVGEEYLNQFFDSKYAIPELAGEKTVAAILMGNLTKDDPIINAVVDVLKDFSQYWQDGWTGATEQQAQQLFMYGKAAFLMDGNWNYGFYNSNLKGIDWGVMGIPLLTKNTTQYAEEAWTTADDQHTYGWGFNKDLENDPDKLKVVLDFFQFMTSKEIQSKMVDIMVTSPVVEGVPVPDSMKPFAVPADKAKLEQPLGFPLYSYAESGVGNPLLHEFLTGNTTKEDFMNNLYESTMKNVKQIANDKLDEDIGIPAQIANLEKQIEEKTAAGVPSVVIETLQNNLDLAKMKLEFYKQYAEPVLK